MSDIVSRIGNAIQYILVEYHAFFALTPAVLLAVFILAVVGFYVFYPLVTRLIWFTVAAIRICLAIAGFIGWTTVVLVDILTGGLLASALIRLGSRLEQTRYGSNFNSTKSSHDSRRSDQRTKDQSKQDERDRTKAEHQHREKSSDSSDNQEQKRQSHDDEFERYRQEWRRRQYESRQKRSSSHQGRSNNNQQQHQYRQKTESQDSDRSTDQPDPATSAAFDILGLKPTCRMETLRNRHKTLAKKYHPDAHPNVTEAKRKRLELRMKEINNAYDVAMSWHRKGRKAA